MFPIFLFIPKLSPNIDINILLQVDPIADPIVEQPFVLGIGEVRASVSLFSGANKVVITSTKTGTPGNNAVVHLIIADTNTKTCKILSSHETKLRVECDNNDSNIRDFVDVINEFSTRPNYSHFTATGGSSSAFPDSQQTLTYHLSGGVDSNY